MKTTLVRILFFFYLGFNAISLKGQDSIKNTGFVTKSSGLRVGSNYSWYKTNYGNYNLNNLEFFWGYSFSYNIGNKIEINISYQGGIKKRNPYKRRFVNYGNPLQYNIEDPFYAYFEVDKFDKVLSHNHYFLELPVNIGYKVSKKIALNAGFYFRYYLPKTNIEEYDFIFDNKFENGISGGASFRLSKRFVLNGNFNLGIRNSYSSYITSNEKMYHSILKFRVVQLNFQYLFKNSK
jgi:hypothetical protein